MDYYNTISGGYEGLHREEQMHKLQIIKDNCTFAPTARILDVGCGPCWSAEFFENVTGIDPSVGLLKQSKNKNVVLGRAEEMPFADGSFEVILCVSAIHHFEEERALREMRRVATPDADVVISVLKKAQRKKEIIQLVRGAFDVVKEIDEGTDIILFCKI